MAEHVCPIWVGWLLLSPLRKWFQNPEKILGPHIENGMTVVDVGSAMGYFSIPMAKMVGKAGRVVCVDMQDKMLQNLKSRAQKFQVADQMETLLCDGNELGLKDYKEKIDFALAFAVVHEVPDQKQLFTELIASLKPGCKLLLSEPKGHVNEESFERCVKTAKEVGFAEVDRPKIGRSYSVLLQKRA